MADHNPSRILVVDDHRPTRQSLCLLLRDVGYACSTAPSVADARARLTPRDPVPALIIVDLWMPEEDGESLLLWTRSQPHLVHTRVAIYSAAPESIHDARLRAAGADDFIPKLIPIPHLLSRLLQFATPNTTGMPTPTFPTHNAPSQQRPV